MNLHRPGRGATTNNLFTRGLKHNIRMVNITQKPQFMLTDIYRLCERVVAFRLHPADIEFFHRQGIPLENQDEKYTPSIYPPEEEEENGTES
ncbi:hypothetical protein ES703_110433 [subsurface metagenome]